MTAYRYLFGPVPSRRFGLSLGVDLTPFKTCSIDCVFCQLGRTSRKTGKLDEYVPLAAVLQEIDHWLANNGQADVITFAGSGEPTLYSRLGDVINHIHASCDIPVLLLTNGTLLHRPEVRAAAALADRVKVSLSAWDEESFARINRPCPEVTFKQLVEGEIAFRQEFSGALYLEVFLLGGMNSELADVEKIAAFARRIQPDVIQLNTAVRPTAEDFAVRLPREKMEELVGLFEPRAEVIANFSSDLAADIQDHEEAIAAMLQRRPCTPGQIASTFGMHLNEVSKYIGKLVGTKRIAAQTRGEDVYYAACPESDTLERKKNQES